MRSAAPQRQEKKRRCTNEARRAQMRSGNEARHKNEATQDIGAREDQPLAVVPSPGPLQPRKPVTQRAPAGRTAPVTTTDGPT